MALEYLINSEKFWLFKGYGRLIMIAGIFTMFTGTVTYMSGAPALGRALMGSSVVIITIAIIVYAMGLVMLRVYRERQNEKESDC